jgi:hypothetical protein
MYIYIHTYTHTHAHAHRYYTAGDILRWGTTADEPLTLVTKGCLEGIVEEVLDPSQALDHHPLGRDVDYANDRTMCVRKPNVLLAGIDTVLGCSPFLLRTSCVDYRCRGSVTVYELRRVSEGGGSPASNLHTESDEVLFFMYMCMCVCVYVTVYELKRVSEGGAARGVNCIPRATMCCFSCMCVCVYVAEYGLKRVSERGGSPESELHTKSDDESCFYVWVYVYMCA